MILAGSIAAGAQDDEEPPTTTRPPAPPKIERVPVVVADGTCASGKRIAYRLYDEEGTYLRQELGKCQP